MTFYQELQLNQAGSKDLLKKSETAKEKIYHLFVYMAKTIKKANTTKLTWKKLKSRKKYYFKIQAYKIVGGKKYSGKYSKIRSVKVK